MSFNFPNSPTTGATYNPGTGFPIYRWDGEKWKAVVTTAATATVLVSDTPPSTPLANQLWWESDTGNLYINYNDGDSTQWIMIGNFVAINGALRFDTAQTLTEVQKAQARQNIYAAPFDAMAYDNILVNGSMIISQELGTGGTTVGPGNTGKYALDGWRLDMNHASAQFFISQVQLNNSPMGPGAFMANIITPPASFAAGEYVIMDQNLEGQRSIIRLYGWGYAPGAGSTPVTIGFFINLPQPCTFSVAIRNKATNRSYVTDVVYTSSSQYEWHTVTIPGEETSGTWAFDNTIGMIVSFCFGAGTTFKTPTVNTWQNGNYIASAATSNCLSAGGQAFLAGVVMLPGTELAQASGFNPPPSRVPQLLKLYDDELRICQRYYIKYGGGLWVGTGMTRTGATSSYLMTPLSVPMRANPNITATGCIAYQGDNNAAATVGGTGTYVLGSNLLSYSMSHASIGTAFGVAMLNSQSGSFVLDARL